MEIKFIEKEDIMEEIILDDIEHVNESLIELKRSIVNNPHLISLRGFEEGACRKSARNFLLW